jgi:hypothetical protein
MPAPDALANLSPGRSDMTELTTGRRLRDGGSSSRPVGAPVKEARWGLGSGVVASSRSGSVMSAAAGWSRVAPPDAAFIRWVALRCCESAAFLRGKRRLARGLETVTRGPTEDFRGDAVVDGAIRSRSSSSVAPRMARTTSSTKLAISASRFSIDAVQLLSHSANGTDIVALRRFAASVDLF